MSIIDLLLPSSKFTPFVLFCKNESWSFKYFSFPSWHWSFANRECWRDIAGGKSLLPGLGILTCGLLQHVVFSSTRLLKCYQLLYCLALTGCSSQQHSGQQLSCSTRHRQFLRGVPATSTKLTASLDAGFCSTDNYSSAWLLQCMDHSSAQ